MASRGSSSRIQAPHTEQPRIKPGCGCRDTPAKRPKKHSMLGDETTDVVVRSPVKQQNECILTLWPVGIVGLVEPFITTSEGSINKGLEMYSCISGVRRCVNHDIMRVPGPRNDVAGRLQLKSLRYQCHPHRRLRRQSHKRCVAGHLCCRKA